MRKFDMRLRCFGVLIRVCTRLVKGAAGMVVEGSSTQYRYPLVPGVPVMDGVTCTAVRDA